VTGNLNVTIWSFDVGHQ